MGTIETWYMGSDVAIYVRHLRDTIDGSYQNAATVSGTLIDSAGVDVPNAVGLSGTYQAGSDGDYLFHIPDTVTLTEGDTYRLRVTAAESPYVRLREVTGIAAYD